MEEIEIPRKLIGIVKIIYNTVHGRVNLYGNKSGIVDMSRKIEQGLKMDKLIENKRKRTTKLQTTTPIRWNVIYKRYRIIC